MPFKTAERKRQRHAEYMKARYRDEPEFRDSHKTKVAVTKARNKAEYDRLIEEFKKDGCSHCGEMESCCLVAHHRNPSEKEFSVSQAVTRGFNMKRVVLELAKCICLCANCHYKVHFKKDLR